VAFPPSRVKATTQKFVDYSKESRHAAVRRHDGAMSASWFALNAD
jgi:hypothetical protein